MDASRRLSPSRVACSVASRRAIWALEPARAANQPSAAPTARQTTTTATVATVTLRSLTQGYDGKRATCPRRVPSKYELDSADVPVGRAGHRGRRRRGGDARPPPLRGAAPRRRPRRGTALVRATRRTGDEPARRPPGCQPGPRGRERAVQRRGRPAAAGH